MGFWQRIRHIRRRQQIVGVLVKNGFGYMVQRLGLDSLTPLTERQTLGAERPGDRLLAQKLRQSLEELGPTFVKLGQVLSTRSDLMPPVFIEELERLQDKVEAMPPTDLMKQLLCELGHPDEVFAEFNPLPLAAASIGQVHLARLRTGEEVIVKVQRPGIEKTVQNDLEIVLGLARLSELRSTEARRLGIKDMVEEFSRMFIRELDYAREARSTERVYQNFSDDKRVVIPRVYWEYTTGKVLTEEYIEGVKLSDLGEIDRRGWNRRKISQLGTETFLSQIILHGFYQADPHPGNILLLDETRIAFIDFGQIGSLSETRLIYLGELLLAVSKQNMDKAMASLQDMGIIGELDNIEDFQEDFADLIKSVSGSIGKINIKRLRNELMDLSYRHQLKMPAYLTGLMKALITVEGVGKKLDPDYDFMDNAQPLVDKALQERLKAESVYKYIRRRYYRDLRPLTALPSNFNRLVRRAGEGRLKIKMEMELSNKAYHGISRLVSRLSASLIITGALIGSSFILQANHSVWVEKFSYLGVLGFAVAIISLVAFLISSLRP